MAWGPTRGKAVTPSRTARGTKGDVKMMGRGKGVRSKRHWQAPTIPSDPGWSATEPGTLRNQEHEEELSPPSTY